MLAPLSQHRRFRKLRAVLGGGDGGNLMAPVH
jgi:hypothetical protein